MHGYISMNKDTVSALLDPGLLIKKNLCSFSYQFLLEISNFYLYICVYDRERETEMVSPFHHVGLRD